MRYTFTENAVQHYPPEVALEVIRASDPRRPVDRPAVLMWMAPSSIAAELHEKRPAGRTGPITIVVLARQPAADHLRVFHCFRPRAKDMAAWKASR